MESILIIDDEPQIRSMIRLLLERAGYSVMEAADGVEGIRRFRENPASLIITDLIMPNKDGIGMMIELKREFPDIKIIAMSGGGLNRPEGYCAVPKNSGPLARCPNRSTARNFFGWSRIPWDQNPKRHQLNFFIHFNLSHPARIINSTLPLGFKTCYA
jgi:hypothetical protein